MEANQLTYQSIGMKKKQIKTPTKGEMVKKAIKDKLDKC